MFRSCCLILVSIDITMSGMFLLFKGSCRMNYLIFEKHSSVGSEISQPRTGLVYLSHVCLCLPCLIAFLLLCSVVISIIIIIIIIINMNLKYN